MPSTSPRRPMDWSTSVHLLSNAAGRVVFFRLRLALPHVLPLGLTEKDLRYTQYTQGWLCGLRGVFTAAQLV